MQTKGYQIGVRFKKYMHRTFRNKLTAIAMFVAGVLVWVLDYDATLLVITTLIGIPLFLTGKRWI